MTARRRMSAVLLAAVAAMAVAILWLPGAARAASGPIEITSFTVTPMPSPLAANSDCTSVTPTPCPSQAGAHPNLRLRVQFCGPARFDPDTGTIPCTDDQYRGSPTGRLKDFILHLPPGLLGNPASVTPCPTHLFLAVSCPLDSAIGYSVTQATNNNSPPIVVVPTPIYRIEETGLEPARLGTSITNSTPPGPFAVAVNLRNTGSTGDYGIDSVLQNVPFVLGSFPPRCWR